MYIYVCVCVHMHVHVCVWWKGKGRSDGREEKRVMEYLWQESKREEDIWRDEGDH